MSLRSDDISSDVSDISSDMSAIISMADDESDLFSVTAVSMSENMQCQIKIGMIITRSQSGGIIWT
jgi:hypothetical protein